MKTLYVGLTALAVGAAVYLYTAGDAPAPTKPLSKNADINSSSDTARARSKDDRLASRRMRGPIRSRSSAAVEGSQPEADDFQAGQPARRVGWGERRAEFDADGDGQLSEEEREAMRQARRDARQQRQLEAFDSDDNGVLDEDELAVQQQARTRRQANRVDNMLQDSDSNADGKLSREEIESRGGRRANRLLRGFDDTDLNGDGQLSTEELQDRMSTSRRERRDDGSLPARPDQED